MTHFRNWLQQIDEYEFEKFVAELWQKRGWETTVTEAAGDRGIDIIATRHEPFEMKQLIQVKRYSETTTVGSPEIQQYASLRQQESNVDAVVVVTTSKFSKQAREIADDLNVKLINGEGLENLIEKYECEDMVLRYVDPSSTINKQSVSSEAETADKASETVVNSADKINGEDERGSKYGNRTPHIAIAALTIWWTFGLGNLAYAAWSYHKTKYANGVPDDYETNVSDSWYYGVVMAILGWGLVISVGIPLSAILPIVEPLMGFFAMIVWILLPLSIYFDIQYVRANSDWNPVTGLWLIGAILMVINVVVGLIYLVRRKSEMGNDRFSTLVRRKIDEKSEAKDESSNPTEELKQQYIEGEIGEAEFDQELERLLETGATQEDYSVEKSK